MATIHPHSSIPTNSPTRESTIPLKHWLQTHHANPYPTKPEKIVLAMNSGMTLTQVSTWFANARRRLKKEGPNLYTFAAAMSAQTALLTGFWNNPSLNPGLAQSLNQGIANRFMGPHGMVQNQNTAQNIQNMTPNIQNIQNPSTVLGPHTLPLNTSGLITSQTSIPGVPSIPVISSIPSPNIPPPPIISSAQNSPIISNQSSNSDPKSPISSKSPVFRKSSPITPSPSPLIPVVVTSSGDEEIEVDVEIDESSGTDDSNSNLGYYSNDVLDSDNGKLV